MRGRLSSAKSYAAGWEEGAPGEGGLCGIVVESNDPQFAVDDTVTGFGPWMKFVAGQF